VKNVEPGSNKFRSYLLRALKHFLKNERDRQGAQKRGGGRDPLSFDWQGAENRYRFEPSHDLTPEKIFDRCWAISVLYEALARLRSQFVEAKKIRVFYALKGALTGDDSQVPYEDIAREFERSLSWVKMTVHRMRRSYRQLLRETIAETVANPDEIEEEENFLSAVISE
jgi:DNA-directed RNA polymerase specialized sigma24 family protein